MLEVSRKQTVKTRKNHECYGCIGMIDKGEMSVYVRGKEDDRHVNFHLHADCHIKAVKRNLFAEGIKKGCLVNKVAPEVYYVANTAYPF